jgi:hypothetical protein
MNKAKGSTIGSAAKALGFKGMWGGLGPRIIMIGTLTALQWFIYDSVKVSTIQSCRLILRLSRYILVHYKVIQEFSRYISLFL